MNIDKVRNDEAVSALRYLKDSGFSYNSHDEAVRIVRELLDIHSEAMKLCQVYKESVTSKSISCYCSDRNNICTECGGDL